MARQQTREMTPELQFLEHHKREYLELSSDCASICFMTKSRAALENMKDLVLLDLKILLGADIPWSHSGKQYDAPSDLAAAALSQARRSDDDSVSSKDDAAAPDAAAPDAAAPEAAAPEAVEPAPDKNNFLTWTHKIGLRFPLTSSAFLQARVSSRP